MENDRRWQRQKSAAIESSTGSNETHRNAAEDVPLIYPVHMYIPYIPCTSVYPLYTLYICIPIIYPVYLYTLYLHPLYPAKTPTCTPCTLYRGPWKRTGTHGVKESH